MRTKNALLFVSLALVLSLVIVFPSHAGLIGETVTFQCPECGPPYSQSFLVTAGGPELRPFDQWTVDVEDSSIRIEWIFNSNSIISPGHFILSDLAPFIVTSAVLDPSSTYIFHSVSFTPDSVTMDFSGIPATVGKFALVNLNLQSVPETSSMLILGSGLLGLVGYGRRRMKK